MLTLAKVETIIAGFLKLGVSHMVFSDLEYFILKYIDAFGDLSIFEIYAQNPDKIEKK